MKIDVKGKQIEVEFEVTYKDWWLHSNALPVVAHTNGATVEAAELRKAGRLVDGREFQDIRLILRGS